MEGLHSHYPKFEWIHIPSWLMLMLHWLQLQYVDRRRDCVNSPHGPPNLLVWLGNLNPHSNHGATPSELKLFTSHSRWQSIVATIHDKIQP